MVSPAKGFGSGFNNLAHVKKCYKARCTGGNLIGHEVGNFTESFKKPDRPSRKDMAKSLDKLLTAEVEYF